MYVEQEFRVLQTDRSLNGVFTYPFTKAQRLEVTGGGRQIGFKQDVTIRTYSLQTGQQLDESREVIQEFENLNLGEASAALVYDTRSSVRPVRSGERAIASRPRKAWVPELHRPARRRPPVRDAGAAVHAGGARHVLRAVWIRRGRLPVAGAVPRLPGVGAWLRPGSFEPGECGVSPDGSCPAFDRLIGSRVGVLNAECASPAGPLRRQELLRSATDRDGALRRRRHRVGETNSPFAGASQEWARSLGVAARMNLFGFAIGEVVT